MTETTPPVDRVVGVLAIQGDYARHRHALEQLGARCRNVRTTADLEQVDALVIPGGESTTIGMLLERHGVMQPLRERVRAGLPVFGTCAGLILLADEIEGSDQPRIGGLHAVVRRNAYGRQVDSFETSLQAEGLPGGPLPAIFIRAPQIVSVAPDVTVLIDSPWGPVLVRQGPLLAATFHPELTDDRRVHAYFLANSFPPQSGTVQNPGTAGVSPAVAPR